MAPVLYSARFDAPYLFQRGRDEDLVCETYRAGAVATPTSGTCTILDEDLEEVATGAVTISGGFATFTLDGATTDLLEFSRAWLVRWVLLMPDGVEHPFESRASLCRAVPHPVVTERTIYARVPSLNPDGAGRIATRTDYSGTIDEAWVQIRNRLIEQDNAIERVISPSAMREALLTLVLALVFEDLAAQNNTHRETAADYRERHEAAWGRLAPPTDDDDDGDEDLEQPARPSLFLI